jgi:hypothetical protein
MACCKASRHLQNMASCKVGFSIQYKAVNEIISMPTPLKSFIWVCAVFLVAAFSSLAQVTNAPADTNVSVAIPTSPNQAPGDVMEKLSGLVHVQKYAEAQQLATGLLLAYPDDQRLIKAKILLDKLQQPVKPDGNVVTVNKSAIPVAVAPSATNQLTGMDKVEYNSLIELGHEAQQTTDLDQQKASLSQFMKESTVFLQRHPEELLLWELRATSALSLDDMQAGYEAGQKLLKSGMADNDQTIQRLLTQLNIKGWLDKVAMEAEVEVQKKSEDLIKKYSGSYSVIGEVKNPGNITYKEEMKEMTVAKAIQAAGGLTDFANKRTMTITRDDSGKKIKVNYEKESDLPVYPGDKIYVAKQIF